MSARGDGLSDLRLSLELGQAFFLERPSDSEITFAPYLSTQDVQRGYFFPRLNITYPDKESGTYIPHRNI